MMHYLTQKTPWNTVKKFSITGLIYSAMLFTSTTYASENSTTGLVQPLTDKSRKQVVSTIINKLEQSYIYPSKAIEIGNVLRQNLKNKDYKNITDHQKFAAILTDQMQDITDDKHLQIEFSEDIIPVIQDESAQKVRDSFEMAMWRAHNFGIDKVERLKFNIGYLKLTAFAPVKEVASLLSSAMNLVNNMDSLIIDLRGNFGGNEQTVQLLASYLLNQRTHLLNMYKHEEKHTEQHWSHDYVEGQRFSEDKDLYILIDKDSFSAAEDFSYTMKNLKRATIIGETSGGAAHSGDMVRLSKHFNLFLPNALPISPITQTNWEGVGVVPHIKTSSQLALNKAQSVILEKLITNEKDPRRVTRIKAQIAAINK